MEGPPPSTASEAENDFDTKKSKKRKRLEAVPQDDRVAITQRRHLAREALRHEEVPEPPKSLMAELALVGRERRESAAETEENAEVQGEAEGMNNEERQYAVQTLRRESRQQHQQTPPASEVPPAVAAGDLFVDEWDARIENGQNEDDALAAVLAEHNLPPDLLNEPLEAVADTTPEAAGSPSPENTENPHEFTDNEVVITPHNHAPEQPSLTREQADDAPDNRTPTGPLPPGRPPAGPGAGAPANSGSPANRGRNYLTMPAAGNAEQYDEGNPAVTAVIGGIIGYFIGRRRGRIKTEKKLLPIQKRLERQVTDLNWELKAKEAKIRRVAAEHVQRNGSAVVETLVAESARASRPAAEQANGIREMREPAGLADRPPEQRRRAPEARQLHGPEAPGHIGHVLVAAEAPVKDGKDSHASERLQLPPDKRIETLPRTELLDMSEHIKIEGGSSLRDIYETHLVGEQGLRRLVAEHLNGGDVQKALRREVVEHQIDFERDPALRDTALSTEAMSSSASQVTAPGKEALSQLLQKAEAGISGDDDALAYEKARVAREMEQSSPGRKRRPVDLIMAATIVVLIALVITLYFSHA